MADLCIHCTSQSPVYLRELVSNNHTVVVFTSDEARALQLVASFRRSEFCDKPKRRLLAGSLTVDRWMARILDLVVTTQEGAENGPRGGFHSVKVAIFENRSPLSEPFWCEKQVIVPFQVERYAMSACDALPAGIDDLPLPGMFCLEGKDQCRLQEQIDLFIRGFSLVLEDSSAPLALVTAMFRNLVGQRAAVLAPECKVTEIADFIRSFGAHMGWLSLKVTCHNACLDYEITVTSRVSDLQAVPDLGQLIIIEADEFAPNFQEIMSSAGSKIPVGIHSPGMKPQFTSLLERRYPLYVSLRKHSFSLQGVRLYYVQIVDDEDASAVLFEFLDELIRKHELKPVIHTGSAETAEVLASQLIAKGFLVVRMDLDNNILWRQNAQVLVTAFTASDCNNGINIFYELPASMKEYLKHAGHDPEDSGKKLVINFVRQQDEGLVKQISQECSILKISPEMAYKAWGDYSLTYANLLASSS